MMDNEAENEYVTLNDKFITEMNEVNINVIPETKEEYHDGVHVEGNIGHKTLQPCPRPIKP